MNLPREGTRYQCVHFLQESVFGEDQIFTDMNDPPSGTNNESCTTVIADTNSVSDENLPKREFDPRLYRPLDIVVSITMHDIQAHLMKVRYLKRKRVVWILAVRLICVTFMIELRGEGSAVSHHFTGAIWFRDENRVQGNAVTVTVVAGYSY